MPKEQQSTTAIVLRTFPYGESDLVLHLFSEDHGKLALLARAARRSKRRFSCRPDFFDRGIFTYQAGRGSLPTLMDFKPAPPFRALRTDLLKLACASIVSETLDYLSKEGMDGQEELYVIFDAGLTTIDHAPDDRAALRSCFYSLTQILAQSGFSASEECLLPSANNLALLTQRVEVLAERELKSKRTLFEFIREL